MSPFIFSIQFLLTSSHQIIHWVHYLSGFSPKNLSAHSVLKLSSTPALHFPVYTDLIISVAIYFYSAQKVVFAAQVPAIAFLYRYLEGGGGF